jgi:hypothetical protein
LTDAAATPAEALAATPAATPSAAGSPPAGTVLTPANPAVIPNTRPGLATGGVPTNPPAPGTVAGSLGLLADLAGTWVGTGFNLISLPDFDSSFPSTGPAAFRLKLNTTLEVLEFTPIGGAVPNRGAEQNPAATPPTGQDDISIFGLRYLQRVADSVTNEAMHIEPGLWLNVPATQFPAVPATVVRQGTIPHGNSILAIGQPFSVAQGPIIDPVSPIPTENNVPKVAPYTDPFFNPAALPPGIRPQDVLNPNQVLLDAIAGQTIVNTVVLDISTGAPAAGPAAQIGGIVNMPFDIVNANPVRLDAIFWIETVSQTLPGGVTDTFLQLQYTQTVTLSFLGIEWPHISVATLTKQ